MLGPLSAHRQSHPRARRQNHPCLTTHKHHRVVACNTTSGLPTAWSMHEQHNCLKILTATHPILIPACICLVTQRTPQYGRMQHNQWATNRMIIMMHASEQRNCPTKDCSNSSYLNPSMHLSGNSTITSAWSHATQPAGCQH